jgi:hypothetical protein
MGSDLEQIYAKIYDKNEPISHEEAESLNAHLHYMYRSGDIKTQVDKIEVELEE